MAEYIKREDVLERIDGIWDCADMVFEPNDHCCNMDDCSSCKWRETKDAIRRIVEHTPAADVVEVVRCKDCKYCKVECGNYCCYVDDYLKMPISHYGDFYCADGERREVDDG